MAVLINPEMNNSVTGEIDAGRYQFYAVQNASSLVFNDGEVSETVL